MHALRRFDEYMSGRLRAQVNMYMPVSSVIQATSSVEAPDLNQINTTQIQGMTKSLVGYNNQGAVLRVKNFVVQLMSLRCAGTNLLFIFFRFIKRQWNQVLMNWNHVARSAPFVS